MTKIAAARKTTPRSSLYLIITFIHFISEIKGSKDKEEIWDEEAGYWILDAGCWLLDARCL